MTYFLIWVAFFVVSTLVGAVFGARAGIRSPLCGVGPIVTGTLAGAASGFALAILATFFGFMAFGLVGAVTQ